MVGWSMTAFVRYPCHPCYPWSKFVIREIRVIRG